MEFGNSVGTQNDAGLPNITGYHAGHEDLGTRYDGCFYDDGDQGNENAVGGGSNLHRVGFDASLSNSIYGNSTTVQPKSLIVSAIIKY